MKFTTLTAYAAAFFAGLSLVAANPAAMPTDDTSTNLCKIACGPGITISAGPNCHCP